MSTYPQKAMTIGRLRLFLPKERKFKCSRCPIPRVTCNAIAKGLWGKERCLIRVVMREVLILHAREPRKSALKRKESPSLTAECQHLNAIEKTGLIPNPDEVWQWCPDCNLLIKRIK